MSIAAGMPDLRLSADPGFRDARTREERRGRLRRSAIIAAALVHAAVIAVVIVHWPALFPVVTPPKPPIPVTLVREVPPAPHALPAPPPPPPPPDRYARVSGADNQTTAPPSAPEKAEEAAPQPAPPPPAVTAQAPAPPEAKPKPESAPHAAKPKLAARETAPKKSHAAVDFAPGEKEQEGDPYLNRLSLLMQEHYHYPAEAIGPLGLHLEGTATLVFGILADGRLKGVALLRSSGSAVLDQEAMKEIEETAPFPPPPPNYVGPAGMVELTVEVHLSPGGSG